MLLRTVKSFFNKSYFDFDSPNIDLFSFHPQLRMLLVFNGIFFNNPDSKLRFIWPFISTPLTLIAASFQMMFIYHGVTIKDYSFATECFCYFVIINTVPLVYISVLFNKNRITRLVYSMNRDFIYICSLNPKYRNTFLEEQLMIWRLCLGWLCFVTTIAVMYLTSTFFILMYQCLFATQTENMIRPLMFPIWLPEDDPYRTPNYEIFLSIQVVLILIVVQTFGVYVYILFHFLLHYYYLMNMIIFDCEVLFHGVDESVVKLSRDDPQRIHVRLVLNGRIRRIVTWHNSVFQSVAAVSSIYGPTLVYQVMFSALAICLTAYQVANSLDHGKLHLIFMMLFIACCVQLWIPCYLGTLLRDKAFAVGDAIWNSGWHETSLGQILLQDIIFIIMRSQKPLTIKFTALPSLDLETFSSTMMSAYSYFNLLRQYK